MDMQRAVNFPFRVQGLDSVRNAFRSVGEEGSKTFAQVEKSANGATREVTAYTAQLRRAVERAKADFAGDQLLNKGSASQVAANRRSFILARVEAEKQVMAKGYVDAADGADALAGRLTLVRTAALGVAATLTVLAGVAYAGLQAWQEHEQALDSFNATLAWTGNASQASAAEIQNAADIVSRATLQTETDALSAAAELAKVPQITKEALTAALDASARFADATGENVTSVAREAGEVLTALAEKDMKALVNALKDVSPEIANMVIELAEAGKTADAQTAYIDALARAAGDGPNALASETNKASKAWQDFKVSVGSVTAGPVVSVLSTITGWLDTMKKSADETGFSLKAMLQFGVGNISGALGTMAANRDAAARGASQVSGAAMRDRALTGRGDPLIESLFPGASGRAAAQAAEQERKKFEQKLKQYGGGGGRTRTGGGRSGKSDAEREAERLAREAERAREAADRVRESNDDAIASYQRRAREAQAVLGLEGDALAAVERQHAIDAAARQLSTDFIDKEVEARRLATKGVFDEAAARAAAQATLDAQTQSIRDTAAALYDAEAAQAAFNDRQSRAAQIYAETRAPLEDLNEQVLEARELLDAGAISADTFNRRMMQVAEDMARAAEDSKDAWRGFGLEVSDTFRDIIFNGGDAIDILQRLIAIPLDRLWEQNVTGPLSRTIDGAFGLGEDRAIAAARNQLPLALDFGPVDFAGIDLLGDASTRAAGAMDGLVPEIGQLGGSLSQIVAMITSGGGGGGGLGSLLSLAGSAAGLASGVTPGTPSLGGLDFSTIPGFAGGGRPPIGVPFDVGENGKERMILLPGGGAHVLSEPQSRRYHSEAGPTNLYQTINIPARADPRRTANGIARATGGALGRAGRKGLAIGPSLGAN